MSCDNTGKSVPYYLDEDDLAKLKNQAASGDVGAAEDVYRHFSMAKNSPEDGIEWLIIALKGGSDFAKVEMQHGWQEGWIKRYFDSKGFAEEMKIPPSVIPNNAEVGDLILREHLDLMEWASDNGNSAGAFQLFDELKNRLQIVREMASGCREGRK